MKATSIALLLAVALVPAAGAQTANDVNQAVTSSHFLSGPYFAPGVTGTPSCPPAGVVEAAFTGTTTQDGRIFRDAIPSTCPTKAYPGIFGTGTIFNYETFTYSNTSAAPACVTVNFDPDTVGATPCTTNAHASAYIGSYDPANQGANFVGDVGSSLAQPFSFEVPANSNMVLVVTNTSAAAICTFGFEILNLPCETGGPGGGAFETTFDVAVPTVGEYGLIALAALMAISALVFLNRRA
jgi:hypothetical protein